MQARLEKLFKTRVAQNLLKATNDPSFTIQEKVSRLATTNVLADVRFDFTVTDQTPKHSDAAMRASTTASSPSAPKTVSVYGHKCILRLGSPVLSDLIETFEALQPDARPLVIPVGDSGVSVDGFREVLRYLYGDVLTLLREDLLESTLKAALTLHVQPLVERCLAEVATHLTPMNFISWYGTLRAMGVSHACVTSYLLASFSTVTAKLDSLREIPRPLLEEVLASDELEMPEIALFRLLLQRTTTDARAYQNARKAEAESKGEKTWSTNAPSTVEYDENGYPVHGDDGDKDDFEFDVEQDADLDDLKRRFMRPFFKFIRFGVMNKTHLATLRESKVLAHVELKQLEEYYNTPPSLRDRSSPLASHRPRSRPLQLKNLRSNVDSHLSQILAVPQIRSFIFSLLPESFSSGGCITQKYLSSPNASTRFNELRRNNETCLTLFLTTEGYIIGALNFEPETDFTPGYLIALRNPQGGLAAWKLRSEPVYGSDTYAIGSVLKVASPTVAKVSLFINPDSASNSLEVAGNPLNVDRLTGRMQCQVACVGFYEIIRQ